MRTKAEKRQGAIAPLFLLLLIPLLGMLAFAIDTGYMCVVKTDLQNAADAAAKAAAQDLQTYYVQYNLPGQNNPSGIISTAATTARATAKKFAGLNSAGNVFIQLQNSDITFGFIDASGNYTSPTTNYPNTVSVVARRDHVLNGALTLFFGKFLGMGSAELQVEARSTIYVGDVSSLQLSGTARSHMLPVALDVNTWTTFYQTGKSPDGKRHAGPNGAYQIQVYPEPKQSPGNFSLLCVGPPVNDTPTFRIWIDNGMSADDIQYQLDHGLLPVSPASPKPWKCGPGMTDTLVSNFADVLYKPNLIPLFRPVSLNPYQAADNTGQAGTFSIVGFASVMVSQCSGNGSNLNLSLQPCAVLDPTAVITNAKPAGTQVSTSFGTSLTTFVAPKLSY